jgi:riboflavin synthase
MFTGIVEELGTVRRVLPDARAGKITIEAECVLEGTKLGDSIAVNGVCLTVVDLGSDYFTADVMPETLRASGLGRLTKGDTVDLERALPANGRFGGHIVSGHIDGTGTIKSVRPDQNAVWLTIATTPAILRLIVEKGSIAIDGVSLTVARVGSTDFQVSIIPHTGEQTVLLKKRPGDVVNLENDIVGKYVQKLMSEPRTAGSESRTAGARQQAAGFGPRTADSASQASGSASPDTGIQGARRETGASPGITREFLERYGF